MSRLSCVRQTFVRSCPDFRAFTRLSCVMSRPSCVHQTFVRSSPDFRAITQLSCVQPIIVRSCPDFLAFNRLRAFMSRLSCVHQVYLLSPGFSAFMSRFLSLRQSFVRSCSYFRAFTRFSFVQRVFVLSCPDFCTSIKLGCDDPICAPSSSDKKHLFKSNTIGMGYFRCPLSPNQQHFGGAWQGKKGKNLLCFLFVRNKERNILKIDLFNLVKEIPFRKIIF